MTASGDALACSELRLRQFRNFPELDLRFPETGVAIIGENGSGKTNLLEAFYYLEIFRSFRGAPDEQLVRFGAEAFHVRGRFGSSSAEDVREVTAAYEPRTRRKRVTLDGAEPPRFADAIGRVGAVVFSPGDMALVAGPPGERRRYLDIVLSLNEPGYLRALQRYRQVLRQRNSVLRGGGGPVALAPWDEALVHWGSPIAASRAGWVAQRSPGFASGYAHIGGGAPARLEYRGSTPSGSDASAAAVAERFRLELARLAQRERDRGATLVGPHRDDLGIMIEGPDGEIDLRDYGSGGQLRTAAVALRLVEADTIEASRGCAPIVLLDDVFAEFDRGRSRRVLELLSARRLGQVILTAPKETDVTFDEGAFTASLAHWRIEAGTVFP